MKIKVEVDLSDLYDESEGQDSLQEIVKEAIKYDVKQQVLQHFKDTAAEQFRQIVVAEVEKEKNFFITKVVQEFIQTKELKKSSYNSEMITVAQYVEEELKRSQVSERAIQYMVEEQTASLKKLVSDKSSALTLEMKDRYDMQFASQFISKMNKMGMLNETAVKALMSPTDEKSEG